MANRKGGNTPASVPKPSGWSALDNIKALSNTQEYKEVNVLISIENATIDEVVRITIEEMKSQLLSQVSIEDAERIIPSHLEMKRYFATALYTRIQWVSRYRNEIGTRPDSPKREWMLPDVFASIINAIGRYDDAERGISYVPFWNPDNGIALMSMEECQNTARRLSALRPDVHMVEGFEKRKEGLEQVMALLVVEDEMGAIVFHHDIPFSPVDAITALIVGRDVTPDVRAVDVLPQNRKKYYLPAESVKQHVFSYCQLKGA